MEKNSLVIITILAVSLIFAVSYIVIQYNPDQSAYIIVHLSRGDASIPAEIHPANMATKLGEFLQQQDRKIIVVLDVRGVNIALNNPDEKLIDTNTRLQKIIENGGRVLVCEGCLEKAGYSKEDIIHGAEIATPEKLSEIFSKKSLVISY